MSRSRHTEAQIVTALKQVEAGRTVDDGAREQGVSKHTTYAWKAMYGGLQRLGSPRNSFQSFPGSVASNTCVVVVMHRP